MGHSLLSRTLKAEKCATSSFPTAGIASISRLTSSGRFAMCHYVSNLTTRFEISCHVLRHGAQRRRNVPYRCISHRNRKLAANSVPEFASEHNILALSLLSALATFPVLQERKKGEALTRQAEPAQDVSSAQQVTRNVIPSIEWGGFDAAGPRDEMEDAWCVRTLNSLSGRILYVGMFDGHGGAASSFFLNNNMLKFTDDVGIKMCSRAVKGDISLESIADETNPLSLAFERADSALLDHLGSLGDPECWSGSTATVCFISKKHIIVANVGDSRAVLGRKSRAIQLSSDHRPIGSSKSGRSEISRVVASGGWISQMRVCGILGVTRAFGDYEFKGGREELLEELEASGVRCQGDMKRPPVIAIPDVRVFERSIDDDFCVVATDGLWDVMNAAQAITFVRTMVIKNGVRDMTTVAQALVQRAIEGRTQDNVSCVVLDLRANRN